MMKVQEIFTGRMPEANNDVSMKLLIEGGQSIDLHLSRDVAINLIQQIYVALDAKDLHKPKNLH